MLLSWHKYGGGKQLLDKLFKSINANVVSFPYGPMPTQPLGWFKKPVTKPDDFKGLKFRTVGISIDVFTGLGAAVNALPGGEIVPAMDRGLLDAAEFNNATSDRILGFADVSKVCMLQSFHQNAEQFEISFNKTKYDALPGGEIVPAMDRGLLDGAEFNNATSDRILGFPDVSKVCMLQSYHQSAETFEITFNKPKYDGLNPKFKAIIANAAEAASADMSWKAIERYSADYVDLQQKHGVKFYKTPDVILKKQLEIWSGIIEKKSATDPMFKKVLESQRAFAQRAGRWQNDTLVDTKMAYNHFFAKARGAPAKAPAKGGKTT
jgi:TRAP-type mannitol/chloroaromatic compound transport system substrate-binding protein